MIKIIFILLFLFLFPSDTKAVYDVVDVRCTNSLKSSLRQEAMDFTYRLSKKKISDEIVYTVYFYNASENIDLLDNEGNKYNKSQIENLKQGTTLIINLVASNNTYCSGYKITTKTIKIPYYNKYYGTDLCKGYENIYLCRENEKILYDEEEFVNQLKSYKEGLEEKEEEKDDEVIVEKKQDIYMFLYNNRYYIGGIIILTFISLIIYIIVKKQRNKGIL